MDAQTVIAIFLVLGIIGVLVHYARKAENQGGKGGSRPVINDDEDQQ